MTDYDLAIIGGVAWRAALRGDVAGRGLRCVILLEAGRSPAGAASSASPPRLIHGDLAGLERR